MARDLVGSRVANSLVTGLLEHGWSKGEFLDLCRENGLIEEETVSDAARMHEKTPD